jgi:hypothetical protein
MRIMTDPNDLPPDPDEDHIPPQLREAAQRGPVYIEGIDQETGERIRTPYYPTPGDWGDIARAHNDE